VSTSWSLGTADATLAAGGEEHVHRLREVLAPVAGDYDVVLVDTPPSIGMWSGSLYWRGMPRPGHRPWPEAGPGR
jgi:hypothetical protein